MSRHAGSTAIIGGDVIVAGAQAGVGDVVFDGPLIGAVRKDGSTTEGSDRHFDAQGLIVSAGFIDAQINGAHGIDVTAEPERIGELGAEITRYGVTAFLPTVITCSPRRRAVALATELAVTGGAVAVGLHLEGPMLAPTRRGAHPEQWLELPSSAVIDGWTRDAGVVMVTIAPELPGAIDAISQLVGDGVVVSIGHTDATAECVLHAKRLGATAVTHLFNAMAPFGHRAPGPIGVALADDSLIAGLICDGIHVDPLVVRVAWQALGPARLMLVTDATAVLGLAPGRRRLGEIDIDVSSAGVRTSDGTLAGSDLALDQAVRNLVAFTGCTAAEAVATVTTTPSRLLGLDDRGSLEAGKRADVTVLDPGLRVVATFVGGALEYLADEEASRWKS
ncbi:MAG TPA: N-acetylglucosamine-6-phosphate deacetylase [Ilumatobacteraceae bacterium]|nr:N-acetylglucosamine-6-phosphate deacetylase [Ilumatobacteraceae bacterium]